MLYVRTREVCRSTVSDDPGAHDDANDEGPEGELRDAKGPSSLLVE